MAKSFIGVVSSDKADKTIAVNITSRKTHPLYKKQYTSSKKLLAHDEKNEAKLGDKVLIAETRPISRRKSFSLIKVLERAPVKHIETTDETIAEVTGQKTEKDEVVKGEKE